MYLRCILIKTVKSKYIKPISGKVNVSVMQQKSSEIFFNSYSNIIIINSFNKIKFQSTALKSPTPHLLELGLPKQDYIGFY